jgi:hypothetical protein
MKSKAPEEPITEKPAGKPDARQPVRAPKNADRKLFVCARPMVSSARPIFSTLAKCIVLVIWSGAVLRGAEGYVGNDKALVPGGITPLPVLKSVADSSNGVVLKWSRMSGPYQAQFRTNLTDGNWAGSSPAKVTPDVAPACSPEGRIT